MPQENLENESLLVSRSPLFNLGLRDGVRAAMETEEVIDRVIETVIDRVISLHEERGAVVNLKTILSVRMTLDEALGYVGGQRFAHERPYVLLPALDTYANASWFAMRGSKFNRAEYRSGFMAGFQDELDGTAQPLPPEQTIVALAY